ncbi:MAG: hypothetical protein HFJ90_07855 [Muribaculaceae bacterium]|jgi:endonuclease I|nr:endonuclease [Muribaculaceae bacterium]MCI9030105.1 hypothetical protein [Muribaculaceae bacterium]
MRNLISGIMVTAGALSLMGEIPAGYYRELEGKSGEELKAAVRKVAIPEDFVSVAYGDGNTSFKTWQAFEFTDIRMIQGRKAWWDMYSNKLVYVESGHNSLNIEHSVANSWWGGKEGSEAAYQDLFHLNPSNSDANNAKSNNPIGIVGGNPAFDNGLVLIGAPAAGYGGGASKVFEPADEYKGDFARAYLYIMTAYDAISWKTDKGGEALYTITDGTIDLQPWAASMLLKWAAEDPVDDKELNRNEQIYGIQKNRNPFIDFPSLAEYIWGDRKGSAFTLEGNAADAVNRPADPAVQDARLTDVNTYAADYWGSRNLVFDIAEGDLWISLDGGSYQRYGDRISIPAGTVNGETHIVKAYAMKETGGKNLRSSVVTVTMTAKDPSVTDYSTSVWTPAATGDAIDPESLYVIISADNRHVMGCTFQSNGFMPDCGSAEYRNQDMDSEITVIPNESAVVRFRTAGASAYTMQVLDVHGNSKGYWTSTAAKKMKLDPNQGTSAGVKVLGDGTVEIDFGSTPGKLCYNKSQPRFLNYTSSQGKVMLYRLKGSDDTGSGVDETIRDDEPVVVDGRDIIVPAGGVVYDLNGRRVSGIGLQPGIYVAVKANGEAVKVYIR